jgi:hypothetical protein
LPRIEKSNIRAIANFDKEYFGGNRIRLIESIILENGNLSYYKSAGTKVVGYVAATVYETMAWVGPLICLKDNVEVAMTLIKKVLSKLTTLSVYMVLPKKETSIIDMLSCVGFKQDFSVVRMFFGSAVGKNCIYSAESLERG